MKTRSNSQIRSTISYDFFFRTPPLKISFLSVQPTSPYDANSIERSAPIKLKNFSVRISLFAILQKISPERSKKDEINKQHGAFSQPTKRVYGTRDRKCEDRRKRRVEAQTKIHPTFLIRFPLSSLRGQVNGLLSEEECLLALLSFSFGFDAATSKRYVRREEGEGNAHRDTDIENVIITPLVISSSTAFVFDLSPPPVSLSFYREHNSYLPRKTCLKSSRPNICAPSAAPLTDCRVSNIDSPRSIRPFFSRYNVAQFGNRVYALELDISGTTGCECWIVKVLEGKILEILRYFSSFVLLVSIN